MSLDEFLKDIYRMPDPKWFSNRWGQIVKEWSEKAEKFDRYNLYKISLEENGVWGTINKLDAKIEAIKKHWFEEVPPFTMPFLDCQDEAVQKYIQDMTEWGREFVNILEDRSMEETQE